MKKIFLLILNAAFLILNCNAQEWSPMNADIIFPAKCFIEHNGTLYVGGHTTRGVHCVAKLDSNKWTNLGGGVPGVNQYVKSMCFYNDELYVSGYFSEVSGVKKAMGLARWNGKEWKDVGGSFDNYRAIVYDFAVYKEELYAAGSFKEIGGKPITTIAKWNGKTWSQVGEGLIGNILDLIVFNDELYAIGGMAIKKGQNKVFTNGLVKWDGKKWTVSGEMPDLPYPNPKRLEIIPDPRGPKYCAFGVFNGELYAAGYLSYKKGEFTYRIQKLNGTEWEPIPKQLDHLIGLNALCEYNGALYAAGEFYEAGGKEVNNIAKWDGTDWSDCAGGVKGANIEMYLSRAIDAMIVYNNELIVSGPFEKAGDKKIRWMAKYKE